MMYKDEIYKGYKITFKEKPMKGNNLVIGNYPSKIVGKIVGEYGMSKVDVLNKCKRAIDREMKIKGIN